MTHSSGSNVQGRGIIPPQDTVQDDLVRPSSQSHLPMVGAEEVAELAARFGNPQHCTFSIQADEYIYSYRWRKDSDRRAEVVFAIGDAQGRVWVHAKSHYPSHIFRLPSGGIHWDEPVEAALLREVEEETHLTVSIRQFVGIIEYRFQRYDSTVLFASYVFLLDSDGAIPQPGGGEMISEFRAILPCQLSQVALDLRNLIGDRRAWGQWRALAHDLVHDHLCG